MQDLSRACRSAQITHNLAGADPTCHMLTVDSATNRLFRLPTCGLG